MFPALPTVHGFIFLLAAGASLAVAIINVGLGTAVLASFLCGFAIAGFLMAQFSLYGVTLRRIKMMDSSCGTTANLQLEITNKAPFSRMSMIVTEKSLLFPDGILHTVVPPLYAGETYQLDRMVKLARRGEFHLNKIVLYSGDPAGLFRRKKVFKLPDEILVSPKITPIYTFPHLQKNRRVTPGQEGRPLGLAGTGQEFFGIRPFRPGDELRFVHWKSSASKGELMIREMEAQTVDKVALILDSNIAATGISEKESNLEFLISCAGSIAEYLSSNFCYLSFYCQMNGHLVELRGDAAGLKKNVMELLTNLRPEKVDFEEIVSSVTPKLEPGTVLFVLSLSCTMELAESLSLLQDRPVYIHWLYAPMVYFPHVDSETPLILDPAGVKLFSSGEVVPYPINLLSEIDKVMELC